MIRIQLRIIVQYLFNPSFRRFWRKSSINTFCLTCRNILTYWETIWVFTKIVYHGCPSLTAFLDWHNDMEARRDVVVALFDLAKVFDKVPHRLLQKLSDLGICGQLLFWVCSYLTNSYQCGVVHGSTSCSCSFWDPLGSVLGPLLFLTFINNLCHIPFSSGSKLVV